MWNNLDFVNVKAYQKCKLTLFGNFSENNRKKYLKWLLIFKHLDFFILSFTGKWSLFKNSTNICFLYSNNVLLLWHKVSKMSITTIFVLVFAYSPIGPLFH